MNDLNSIIIEGVLIGQPMMETLPSGIIETVFKLSSKRYVTKETIRTQIETRVYIRTFGRLAETCCQYLHEGKGVRVVGRIQTGITPSLAHRLEVIGEHVEFKTKPKIEEGKEAS